MRDRKRHRLIEIDWPESGKCKPPPKPSTEEFEAGIDAARSAIERFHLSHLAIYGDPENFANIAYLTGSDSRFE